MTGLNYNQKRQTKKISMKLIMKKMTLILGLCLCMTGCGAEKEPDIKQDVAQNQMMNSEAEPGISETTGNDAGTQDVPSIDWDEKKIMIPELTREYKIWFFADSHIIIADDSQSEEEKKYAAERMPVFANEKGIDSSQILSDFIEQANEEKPDVILFGGDILDSPSDANVAFLQSELEKLTVPYVFVMGNHDWTFPWEYMTENGSVAYRPLFQDIMTGNMEEGIGGIVSVTESAEGYASVTELDDFVILAVDDSSNQVAAQATESIELAYELNKPIVLLQHVPFSTENLIARAKDDWATPVTIGMQVHGGLAPNDVSADLFGKAYEDDSLIRLVLAGHVHFPYEEQLTEATIEIITDAAYKGKALKLTLEGEVHEYFCDKFMLTVDGKQIDLKTIEPDLSSVSALQQITNKQLFVLGRIDESRNLLLVYDFEKQEIVFKDQGVTMCWVQNDYASARFLKDNVVYDLEGNVIYQPDSAHTINMIEYVDKDFVVTIADLEHQNPEQVWVE